mgnify:CR=1 FL=1
MFFERYNYLLLMVQQGTACRYPALLMVYLYFPFTIKSL